MLIRQLHRNGQTVAHVVAQVFLRDREPPVFDAIVERESIVYGFYAEPEAVSVRPLAAFAEGASAPATIALG